MTAPIFKEWSPEVEAQAQKNMDLGRKINDCHEQMRKLRTRLRKLEQERRNHSEVFRLMTDAYFAWQGIRKSRKWTKPIISAALKSPTLPFELTEAYIKGSGGPTILRDRDIMLLRAKRPDFSLAWVEHADEEGEHLLPQVTRFEPQRSWWSDKELITALIRAIPGLLGRVEAPDSLKDDGDIIKAILHGPAIQVHKVRGIKHASNRIKRSTSLMLECLEVLGHKLACPLWDSSLWNNKSFALKVAAKLTALPPSPFFRRFSQRLRADRAVVLAFSEKGVCIGDASLDLRRDRSLVRAAARFHPRAITKLVVGKHQRGSSPTNSKVFMLELLRSVPVNCSLDAEHIYKKCSKRLQKDHDILIEAARKGATLPSLFEIGLTVHDLDLWISIISENPMVYYVYWQESGFSHNLDLARMALKCRPRSATGSMEYESLVELLSTALPEAFDDRQVQLNLAGILEDCSNLLDVESLDMGELLADRELVCALAEGPDPEGALSALVEVDSEFLNDGDVMQCFLSQCPTLLEMVPVETQVAHPETVICAFQNAVDVDLEFLLDDVSPLVLENRSVVLAYLKSGGLVEVLEEFDLLETDSALIDDAEICLAMVEYGDEENLYLVPDRWLRDKEFMMKAVAKSPFFYFRGNRKIKNDMDVLLVAAEGDEGVLNRLDRDSQGQLILAKFAKHVRSEIALYRSMLTFLCGIHDPSSVMQRLECGRETKRALTTKIIGYAGTPERLKSLFRMSTELCNRGF